MDNAIPAELEERIRYYEYPGNDPGPLTSGDWMVFVLAGIALPVVCLVVGWFVGWPA